jgi:hypothetical protein
MIYKSDPTAPLETLESEREPGYFNGLGTPGRSILVQSDTAFSSNNTLTQRFEIAGYIGMPNPRTGLVLRADFGAQVATESSFYSLQGPRFSIGGRLRSRSANEWIEAGVRIIPNWPGPHDGDPAAIQLALNSTLSSGVADDAQWLSFASWGYQIYAAAQSRGSLVDDESWSLLLGAHYGGETSLAPLTVRTWLGSQQGIVANTFLEVFMDAPRLGGAPINLQVGGRADVSLSSIWPGNDVFPFIGSFFAAWSPESWFEARVFYGVAYLIQGGLPTSYPFGARAALYFP